jgi:hypothetical protein
MTGGEGIRREQTRLRVLYIGGSVVAALGILALASGDFRRGTTSLVIGLVGIMLAVKRTQWLAAVSGATATTATAWYIAALGLVLMGGGAAITVPARDAETSTAEMVGFLSAGVLLWMGVTCLIAAVLKARRGDTPSPPWKGRRNKPSKSPKGQRAKTPSAPPKGRPKKPPAPRKGRRGRSG